MTYANAENLHTYALPMLGRPDFETPNGRYRAQIRGDYDAGPVLGYRKGGVVWSGEVYGSEAEALAVAGRRLDALRNAYPTGGLLDLIEAAQPSEGES